jgi:hypothetical protein
MRRYIGMRYTLRTFVVNIFISNHARSRARCGKIISEAEAENEPRKATN